MRKLRYSSSFLAWYTDFTYVTYEKIHWPPSKVVEVKKSFWRSLRPNFVFVFVFMSFHLEFSSYLFSMKIQHRSSFGLNSLKNGSVKYFKNCMKLLGFFQGLIWRIYHWVTSKLIQIFLPGMCEMLTQLKQTFW